MSTSRESFGRYEVISAIGAGGMGEVYVARDPQLGRRVAIKMLPPRMASDRDSLARFTHEARSASALNHPNIVTIHEVGSDDSGPYIVMEYVEGSDLRSMIRDGALPVRKVVDIGAQIAEGLSAAHERGIVHRDLKPENIMVTRDGFVKILDFGLAKTLAPSPDSSSSHTLDLDMPGTNPGTILGTVGYMSPEQATGKRLDFRSDQFALGAILHELATGNAAFEAENAIDTLSAILHSDPPPITKSNPRAPAQLTGIVNRLLEKKPDGRYASTRDLARELRLLRDRVVAEESGFHMSAERSPLRVRPLAAILMAAALALFLAGIWFLARNRVSQQAAVTAPVPVAKKYLAVVRFKDLSGDANGQLVADGFTETLSARLAQFSSVQVTRPPQQEPKTDGDFRGLARELGATLILTGSMQRMGQQVRISYSLFDAAANRQRTADVVDGTVDNLFAMQDRLAGNVARALELDLPALKTPLPDPGSSQRQYLEALGLLRRYDDDISVDRAIRILEDLSAGENSASIRAALAKAYLTKFTLTREPDWARRAGVTAQQAFSDDVQNPDVHVTLGEVHRQTGKVDEAIAEYRRALAEQPNNAEAILGLAETYKASNRLPEAEREYRRAIDLQPQFWGGYNKLGVFFFSQGRYREASPMFETVIKLVPDNLRGYNNLGASLQQMGNYDEAIRVYSQSIARKPTSGAYSNLGTCMFFLGRYGDAANSYEQATRLSPNDYRVWENLADAYRWSPGHSAQAAVAYEKAVRLADSELRVNARDSNAHAVRGNCLAKLGRLSEGQRSIDTALKLDPTNVNYMFRAAVIANLRRDQPRALEWLRKAIGNGYSVIEVQRDPELANLRQLAVFQQILKNGATIH